MKLINITLNKLVDTPQVGDKNPSHRLVASDEKYENKSYIGSMWLKSGQNGNFLSGSLSKARSYEGKDYDGYVVITEKEWNEYQELKNGSKQVKSGGFTGEVADVSEIDF